MITKGRVKIVYWRYFDFDGGKKFIGGIETYIHLLAECCHEIGFEAILYQCASKSFVQHDGNLKVIGVPVADLFYCKKTKNTLLQAVCSNLSGDDILIFGSDIWSKRIEHKKTILIQHGIGFDRPIKFLSVNSLVNKSIFFEKLKRFIERKKCLDVFENTEYKVCVDYNFPNWYRTYRTVNEDSNLRVIINPTPFVDEDKIKDKLSTDRRKFKILFARRFEPFRGSRFMIQLASKILEERTDVVFTFAGDGLDDKLIKETFGGNENVQVVKIPFEGRMNHYYDHDISIIPSFGSEGTSLTVAESMASGCVVITSGAGGITNMVFDGYNGYLAWPNVETYTRLIHSLLEDHSLRAEVALKGYEVAKSCFSIEKWNSAWKDLLDEVVR